MRERKKMTKRNEQEWKRKAEDKQEAMQRGPECVRVHPEQEWANEQVKQS